MLEKDYRNATKLDNADLVRNTMKADPAQYDTPIPFQSGYSRYEAQKGSQSFFEIIAFYAMGFIFSVVVYVCLIKYSILNEEWQNNGMKVAILIFSLVSFSFILSKSIIWLARKVRVYHQK